MRTLFIYADFDWLEAPMLVGELGYESLRGSDSYSFKYDNEWLRQYGGLFLSADINNYPGQQYTGWVVSALRRTKMESSLTVKNRFVFLH